MRHALSSSRDVRQEEGNVVKIDAYNAVMALDEDPELRDDEFVDDDKLRFLRVQSDVDSIDDQEVAFRIPLEVLCTHLPLKNLRKVVSKHSIVSPAFTLEDMVQKCAEHSCDDLCVNLVTVFQKSRSHIEGLDSISNDLASAGVQLIPPPEDVPAIKLAPHDGGKFAPSHFLESPSIQFFEAQIALAVFDIHTYTLLPLYPPNLSALPSPFSSSPYRAVTRSLYFVLRYHLLANSSQR